MRLVVIILLIISSTLARCQERVIDLSEIYAVVDKWAEAHNDKDVSALERLYTDEVVFYAREESKVRCLGIKSERFQSPKFYYLEIVRRPVITVYDTDIIRASFDLQITSGSAVTDADTYLLLRRVDGRLRIMGESDLITDGKANYVPNVGKELKTALLSERRLQVEESYWDRINILVWVVPIGGIVMFVLAFMFWRRRKTPHKKDEHVSADKRQEIGLAFEKFVVSRFNPQFFKLLEWTSDKIIDGIYARSTFNPDLHYEFKYRNNAKQFAVECKYRRFLPNGQIQFEERQLENYRRYGRARGIPVFIALGLGGKPNAPKELYMLPIDLFWSNSSVGYDKLREYFVNPQEGLFLNLETDAASWFKRSGVEKTRAV